MNKWYTLFLLVALWSDSQSANAASLPFKKQADLINPGSTGNCSITESVDSSHDQPEISPASIVAESHLPSNLTASPSVANISAEKLVHQLWCTLIASSKRLGEAFERYDRAKASKSADMVILGYELRFLKMALDKEYLLYQNKVTELNNNSTNSKDSTNLEDSTNSKDSTDLNNSTYTKDSTNLKDSTNSKDSTNAKNSVS